MLVVTGILTVTVERLSRSSDIPTLGVFIFITLFVFIWIWLAVGELRTKVIKVELDSNQISASNYFGLGTKKLYSFSEFEGFQTALLPSKYSTYEYLSLVKDGKKVIKLSQFYHSNYSDLKHALIGKVPNLGQRGYTLLQEVREIFI